MNEKKSFNDRGQKTLGLVSGDTWYSQQAFRALNQVGWLAVRCRGCKLGARQAMLVVSGRARLFAKLSCSLFPTTVVCRRWGAASATAWTGAPS